MKTVTEIEGIHLREIYVWRGELMRAQRVEPSPPPPHPPKPPAESGEPKIKSVEERIAEFEQRKKEERERHEQARKALLDLVREPLMTRIREKFKWSDERIEFIFQALDHLDEPRLPELRRVVIWKFEKEGEAQPKYAMRVGEHAFVMEYLPPKKSALPPVDDRGKRRGRRPPNGGRRAGPRSPSSPAASG